MTDRNDGAEAGSQTLARGIQALVLIGEAAAPVTVPAIAVELGIHRSMAYRLVKTLEQHGLVERSADGTLAIGTRLLGIVRNVARDLQSAAMPELLRAANELEVTVFLVGFDGEAAVTIASAEPWRSGAPVGQRPGTRHPVDRGAPGRIIRSQLQPDRFPPERFEVSRDEVFHGLTSVAVPLRAPDGRPVSIAALFLSSRDVDPETTAKRLAAAAAVIEDALR